MKYCLICVILIMGFGWSEPAAIPATPAGQTFRAWLDAFNSGDKDRIQTFLTKYQPKKALDEVVSLREQSGGFELLGVDKSDKLVLEVRLLEKAHGMTALGRMEVSDGDPALVASFRLRVVPAGSTAAAVTPGKINEATRARAIAGAIAKLNESYVFPETAKKMEEALRAHQSKHEYDGIEDGDTFAKRVTDDLRAVSHDLHLHVNYSAAVLPEDKDGHNPADDEFFRNLAKNGNCGFEKVERLASNIGYLKFNFFLEPDVCAETASAAMNFLANTDALIIDLRSNGGGEPAMVAFIASYLFDSPVHLNDLYNRKEDSTSQYWTLPYVPGKKFGGNKPVFVLTSRRTFSGAEEFSYDLKNLKRATIIGETTGGGAHPVEGHRIDDHFLIGVPFARAINPVTKTNWEGKGVEPDVRAPGDESLAVAKQMAVEQMKKNPPKM